MIRRLFLRRRKQVADLPPPSPERLTYVVGDVHGRADLLLELLELIFAEARDWGDDPPRLVFLGDYVDRGEGARDTLDLLLEISGWSEVEPVFLMGNHEQMMLRFLAEPEREAR